MTGGSTPCTPLPSGGVLSRGPVRPMSVEAMRSAVIAVRAGAFDGAPAATDVVAQVAATRPTVPPPSIGDLDRAAVVVLPAHAGAGASTVALAVAEGLSAYRPVQLVEYADPHRSGLAAASSSELGVDESGWHRGRRNRIDLARRATDRRSVDELSAPPSAGTDPSEGDGLLVIDVGWPVAEMLSGSGWTRALQGGARLVVVCRVTVPAVRQTEHVLGVLEVPAVVACVGSGRWPGMVAASCGPALRAARAAGRVVPVPVDRRLAIAGLTPDPLPRPVAAAGRALASLLALDPSAVPDPPVTPLRECADVPGVAR
ncbi:hypothetical protein FHU33_3550 [Blastococcus colisei]|uniref:MinD-like ATPase involved in chromosome partitioning or flagellar assembly n=1 Tax=Blastococcus colisei TaxID=1564162 RepID=A0A543PJ22_9ACTN|nr:hypothetical protein FHU33_3550 [Blastococcus colisei]